MDKLSEILKALSDGEVTQSALSEESGLAQTTISAIAAGRTGNPGVRTVESLHAALVRVRARAEVKSA